MPWNPKKKKIQPMSSSETSESISSSETPIKLEEVEEEDTETYLLPARKLSVEEAKLAAERLAKDKKLVAAAKKKVIRQL